MDPLSSVNFHLSSVNCHLKSPLGDRGGLGADQNWARAPKECVRHRLGVRQECVRSASRVRQRYKKFRPVLGRFGKLRHSLARFGLFWPVLVLSPHLRLYVCRWMTFDWRLYKPLYIDTLRWKAGTFDGKTAKSFILTNLYQPSYCPEY
jgi:hypothetical protein